MKKDKLSTNFNTRQYMASETFEIFYYNDLNLKHVSSHTHDYYEIYFFLEGDVSYIIAENEYKLKYGDILLIPPNTPHHPVFKTPDTSYRRLVLWINKKYFSELIKSSNDFYYAFEYAKNNSIYQFRLDFICHQKLQGILLDLISELNSKHVFWDISSKLIISSFIIELNKNIYDLNHQTAIIYENVLYLNICDYINNHLDEELTLDNLSTFFYVSKYHISHIFKDNMGISLHQYITKKRLQASKSGILSGIPISNLLRQYGFNDYSSFYRAFKKEFGVSPTEFKQEHKVININQIF